MEQSEHKLVGRINPDTCEPISKESVKRFGIGTYLDHFLFNIKNCDSIVLDN